MSRRQSHHQNRSFSSETKKFVPKNPNPTLSNSLRRSHSSQSDTATSSSMGRIRLGDGGGWVPSGTGGNFVIYLPQDEAVAAGFGAEEGALDPVESQRVVDILNRELSRLLKLTPRQFWRQVASDSSLHEFLDSFLKFRSRWYDFPHRGVKGIVAGVIVGELELCRRVFMVLYRISSNKDPGARNSDVLSSKDHAALLQEKKLLDLPKLLDICAIYGRDNEELTGLIVRNAFKAQPSMHEDLTAVMSHFLGIVHTMHQRCITSLEVLFSTGSSEDQGSALLADFLEVLDFMNDAIVSMDALVAAYKPAAVFFSFPIEMSHGNEELLLTLTKLHDTLLPSLRQGFYIILNGGDERLISNIVKSLKMLSTRMVSFGWKLLDSCYLGDKVFEDSLTIPTVTKMFPAKVEDSVVRADILIQTFREMSGSSVYALDNQEKDLYLPNLGRNYSIMSRIQSLQSTGWISLDDEQLQYLSGIMMSSSNSTNKEPLTVSSAAGKHEANTDEDAAIMESKISQIKDLFPDYGKGFLASCLEAYSQNVEEVIQRILEGTLHQDLQCLDTSLETMPQPKSISTVSGKDKGKGKLDEPASVPLKALPPHSSNLGKQGIEVPSVSSSSSSLSTVGRFIRKSESMPSRYNLDVRDDNDAARTAALISQYEYEDEYDDSFDDLGFSVADSGLEVDEVLSNKINYNLGKPPSTESESLQVTSAKRWGSRKKPQYYVKDGKNYSYKVDGSMAVANLNEASVVTQAHSELIHGLGRGGNLPLGAVKKLTELQEQENQFDELEVESGRGYTRNLRGRGRRGGRGGERSGGRNGEDNESNDPGAEARENAGNFRGRGRRGRGSDHHRKDRAMKKHFSGVSGV